MRVKLLLFIIVIFTSVVFSIKCALILEVYYEH